MLYIRMQDKAGQDEKFKPRQLRQIVLAAIGISLILGGSIFITPNFPIIFTSIIGLIKDFKKKDISGKKVKRVLKNLEKKEILYLNKSGGEVFVHIKNFLNPTIIKYSIQSLLELKKQEEKWNGKWYLVMFDVPEIQRNKRTYLRNFLKYIGFYPYQKSVYLFPYECEQEIQLIKKIVEGAKYLNYIIADKIEQEEKVKIFFDLANKS